MPEKQATATKAPPKGGASKKTDETAKEAKKGRPAVSGSDRFFFVANVTEEKDGKEVAVKVAPQARGIVATIEAAGDKGITRDELVKALDPVIETRQPVGRILTYYQKMLKDRGFIRIEKAESAE